MGAFVEGNCIGVTVGELKRITEMPERERVLRMPINKLSRELNAVANAILLQHCIDQIKASLGLVRLQRHGGLQPHGALDLVALRVQAARVVNEHVQRTRDNGVLKCIRLWRFAEKLMGAGRWAVSHFVYAALPPCTRQR